MEENDLRNLESMFARVEDPRMERTKLHHLRDIIILAMCGVLCGAEGWVEIEEFGKAKEAFFTELLTLTNGIPSHDPFGRVFALVDPKQSLKPVLCNGHELLPWNEVQSVDIKQGQVIVKKVSKTFSWVNMKPTHGILDSCCY